MFNIGEILQFVTGGRWKIIARQGCGAMDRRDVLYSFDSGVTLTGREIALNGGWRT